MPPRYQKLLKMLDLIREICMDERLRNLVSNNINNLWKRVTEFGAEVVTELRGEKKLSGRRLNNLVIDVAEVFEKHGYPLRYDESYNAIRLAIAQEYFRDWLDYDITDAVEIVDWDDLKQKRNETLLAKIKRSVEEFSGR